MCQHPSRHSSRPKPLLPLCSDSATLVWLLPNNHKYASVSRPLQCPPSCQSLHKRLLIPPLTSGVCSNATLSDKPTLLPALLFYFTLWWWWWCSHLSYVRLLQPHGLACQAPLSMGFPRQEYWDGLPLPSGDLPDPGIEPTSLVCPALAGGFFINWATRETQTLFFFTESWGPELCIIHCFSSVQSLSRVRLCDPMNHSTPGLPVYHQLPEFTIYSSTTRIVPSSNLKSYVSISLNEDQRVAWEPFWGRWCAQLRIGFYSLGKRDLCFWCSLEWILIFVSPYIDLWLQSDWTVFQILKPTVFLPSDS